jgi:hypothetical protein
LPQVQADLSAQAAPVLTDTGDMRPYDFVILAKEIQHDLTQQQRGRRGYLDAR